MPAVPISAAEERRILAAAETAAELGDSGDSPDQAIAQSAQEHGLPRGHLNLLVHAYNIGTTNRRRQDGSTVAEKAAEFPLASLSGVLEALYPESPATKAAYERAHGVDAIYSRPPVRREMPKIVKVASGPNVRVIPEQHASLQKFAFGRKGLFGGGEPKPDAAAINHGGLYFDDDNVFHLNVPEPLLHKIITTPRALHILTGGSDDLALHMYPGYDRQTHLTNLRTTIERDWQGKTEEDAAPRAAPEPEDPDRTLGRAMARSQKRARVLAETRRWTVQAQDRLRGQLNKLAGEFERPGGPTIDDVRANVQILHGGSGMAILDHVAEVKPVLAKRASQSYRVEHPVSKFARTYDSLADSLQAAEDLLAVRALHNDMVKAAATIERLEMAPFRPQPKSVLDQIELEADLRKQADGLLDKFTNAGVFTAVNRAAEEARDTKPDDSAARALSQISSPEHEQQLRAIQARAMLHEMLHHDEVLRGHDPYEVAHHYNRLSQFAPHLADQPLAAIPAVRKSVQQGHLDSFDASEIASTESKLRANLRGND